jgi:hypothetical protein
MIPVFYWNIKNDFISFAFQGNRIGFFHTPFNWITFLQFNLGQFFYHNPVLFVIYLITIYNLFSKKRDEIKDTSKLLLYMGIPLILTFTILSVFRNTLPHWTGPAYICIIILSSDFLSEKFITKRRTVIASLTTAILVFLLTLVLGVFQINYGIIEFKNEPGSVSAGKNDFTLDMYGWAQAKEKFTKFLTDQGISSKEYNNLAVLSDNWFPSAHLDYYIAHPMNIKLIALGKVGRIHKYYWINKTRIINHTDRVFYITDSRNYHDPESYKDRFNEIIPRDTLTIKRNNKTVRYLYIYEITGIRPDAIPDSPHPGF